MRIKTGVVIGALSVVAVALLAACGSSGNASRSESGRVIEIAMQDVRYEPATVQLKTGETVTFRFKNHGSAKHEAFIGTMAEQEAHAKEMKDGSGMSSMSMNHDSEPVLQVDPGKTSDLEYTAQAPGTVVIGCHQPGHWEAGMRATVTVA